MIADCENLEFLSLDRSDFDNTELPQLRRLKKLRVLRFCDAYFSEYSEGAVDPARLDSPLGVAAGGSVTGSPRFWCDRHGTSIPGKLPELVIASVGGARTETESKRPNSDRRKKPPGRRRNRMTELGVYTGY